MNVIYQSLFGLSLSPAAKKLFSFYIMNCFSFSSIGFESDKAKFLNDIQGYRDNDRYVLPIAPNLSIRRLMDKLSLSKPTIIKAKQEISEYIDNDMLVIPTYMISCGYVKLQEDDFLAKNPAVQITYSYLHSLAGDKATYYDDRMSLCGKLGVTLTNLNNQIAKLKKEGYISVNKVNGNLKIIK